MNYRIDILPDLAQANVRASALERDHPGAQINVKQVAVFVVNEAADSQTWNNVWLVEATIP